MARLRFDPRSLVPTSQLRQVGVEPLRRPDGQPRYQRVRHGVCMASDTWEQLGGDERHRAFVHATALMARARPHVFSHHSAAAAWGMPTIGPWPRTADVVVEPRKAHSSSLIVRHEREHIDVREIDGIWVTSAAQTVVDLARDGGLADGLAAADYAVRLRLCTREDIAREVRLLTPRTPNVGVARLVSELVDPLAESAGESLSRAQMFLLRFPRPTLQVQYDDADGMIGRVDFDWGGVIGEFDGAVKYGSELAETADDARAVVYREKLREDRLRALPGKQVARWGWRHARDGEPMARRLIAQGLQPQPRRTWLPLTPREK